MSEDTQGYTGDIKVLTDVEINNTILIKHFSTLEFKDGMLVGVKGQEMEKQNFALSISLPSTQSGQ